MGKFYAVIEGRYGTDVYNCWDDCQAAVDGVSGAKHRSFKTAELAWTWICASADSNHAALTDIKVETTGLGIQPASPSPQAEVFQSDVQLSEQQQKVVAMCQNGESVFFTGSAGTGKSVCLRYIIELLRRRHTGVFVTASTGIAAINVGGQTLHSWAGIGLGKEPVEKLQYKINRPSKERWLSTNVLVIDEISMIDGRLFDKLEHLARLIRRDHRPFGGIQLIVCGDFFQLPPVPDSLGSGQKIPIKFAFEADSWKAAVPNIMVLTEVFRQKEGDLISMLNMMRVGEIDALGLAIFQRVSREIKYEDGIKPTELFSLRKQVEDANTTRLNALPGEMLVYSAVDVPGYDIHENRVTRERATKLLDDSLAPRELKLRVGAQVMLIKNTPERTLVNGSLGTVVEFLSEAEAKSQGMPTTHAENPEGNRPPPRPIEVAAVPESASPVGENSQAQRQNPRYPTVRFTNGAVRYIVPDRFEAVNATGGVEATRHQMPLILAWALSIHKSQGQTIERVKVNLQGVFEKGQAYVAVSRATGLAGLEVVNFTPDRIMAHPRVIAWSESIQEIRGTIPVEEKVPPGEEMYWD